MRHTEPHELRRRGHIVFPAYADRTSYPDLVRQVSARGYPAWVFINRTKDELRARPLLAAAGYRRSTNGLFAVYLRTHKSATEDASPRRHG